MILIFHSISIACSAGPSFNSAINPALFLGIYRKISPQCPIFSISYFPSAIIKPVLGIYKKNLLPCPFFHLILGTDYTFFSICPQSKSTDCFLRLFVVHNTLSWAQADNYFLYAQFKFFFDSYSHTISLWSIVSLSQKSSINSYFSNSTT